MSNNPDFMQMGIKDDKIISGPEVTFPVPECSLGEYLLPKMKSQPRDHVIQVDSETGESQTTWELLKISAGLAQGLLNVGLQENDVVALLSKNRIEAHAATLAVIWNNGIAAPLNSGMKVHELKHMFGLIQPKYVFTENEALENVDKALSLLGIDAQIILFETNKDYEISHFTFAKLILDVDVESYTTGPIKAPSTQLAVIVPSSGSTGLPKWVGLTHRNLIFDIALMEFSEPLSHKPLLHLFDSCVMRTIFYLLSAATGTKRIFVKNMKEDSVLKAIRTYKPTWAFMNPWNITSLMDHPDFNRYDVTGIKLIMLGGSVISPYLMDKSEKSWNEAIVTQIYGMTECGLVAKSCPAVNKLSIGKLEPGFKLKVVDVETKKPLGPNQTGELCVKSIGRMKCYVGNPEATNDAIDSEGWFHTGDLGYYDDNQYLFIVDRIKEMFKSRILHISPAELEGIIETLPGVLDVGVVGIPHEIDMYHPMALVVKGNESTLTEEDVKRIVKENLSDLKQLTGGVKFVQTIPRTAAGKIKRRELDDLAMSLYKN